MIDDFSDPEFFPGKLKMMEKKRPQNFLLTGMSDLSGWKPEWRDEVFAKIRENCCFSGDSLELCLHRNGR